MTPGRVKEKLTASATAAADNLHTRHGRLVNRADDCARNRHFDYCTDAPIHDDFFFQAEDGIRDQVRAGAQKGKHNAEANSGTNASSGETADKDQRENES